MYFVSGFGDGRSLENVPVVVGGIRRAKAQLGSLPHDDSFLHHPDAWKLPQLSRVSFVELTPRHLLIYSKVPLSPPRRPRLPPCALTPRTPRQRTRPRRRLQRRLGVLRNRCAFCISPACYMLTIKPSAITSAQLWGARRVVGVDIDDALVRMAWRRRRTFWSHQAPSSLSQEAVSSCPTGSTSRLNLKRKRAPQPHPPPAPPEADYFPASCQHMFGPLPIPPSSTDMSITLDSGVSENAFPHNVSFRRADWVNERILEDEAGYDVILA